MAGARHVGCRAQANQFKLALPALQLCRVVLPERGQHTGVMLAMQPC